MKTEICESKSVPVHVEAVIAPPSPIRVNQTPGADGLEAKPQFGARVSTVAPDEVDPNESIPAPGAIGPKASSQESLSTIRSSKNSRVLELADNSVEATSDRCSTPLAAVHATAVDEEDEPP